MGVISKLDHRGHGLVATWDKADKLSFQAAEATFGDLVEQKNKMFDISDEKPEAEHRELKAFDPNATEILAVPQLQGG